MSVVSLKNKLRRGNLLVGNDAYDPAATWLIQRINGNGSSSSITFSSIPTGYTSLQIRLITRGVRAIASEQLYVRLNGDTGNNYVYHYLYGDGTGPTASGATASNVILVNEFPAANETANIHSTSIIDISDFNSTSRNKTVRMSSGYDNNGNTANYLGKAWLGSGLWLNTNAITSITVLSNGAFAASSTFALYGFKGA